MFLKVRPCLAIYNLARNVGKYTVSTRLYLSEDEGLISSWAVIYKDKILVGWLVASLHLDGVQASPSAAHSVRRSSDCPG
jgi:hypothetical protein